MEYFILGHDDRIDEIGYEISFPKDVLLGYAGANERSIAQVKQGRTLTYGNIIERPVFLVSNDIKNILYKFNSKLQHKSVVVSDPGVGMQIEYYMIDYPEVPCISLSHSLIDKGVLKKIVLNEKKIEDQCIFKVKHLQRSFVIVRLDVAEALLRKSLLGLNIKRIKTEGGEEING